MQAEETVWNSQLYPLRKSLFFSQPAQLAKTQANSLCSALDFVRTQERQLLLPIMPTQSQGLPREYSQDSYNKLMCF